MKPARAELMNLFMFDEIQALIGQDSPFDKPVVSTTGLGLPSCYIHQRSAFTFGVLVPGGIDHLTVFVEHIF